MPLAASLKLAIEHEMIVAAAKMHLKQIDLARQLLCLRANRQRQGCKCKEQRFCHFRTTPSSR